MENNQGTSSTQMPSVLATNKVAVVGSASDLTLYFGVGRSIFGPDGNVQAQHVDFGPGYMMSMVLARQMKSMLDHAIATWESQFGPIPIEEGEMQVHRAPPPFQKAG